jgi:hypothetical protein
MKKGFIHTKNCLHCVALRGKPSWNKGLTKETSSTVKKYSESNRGRKLSEDHRKKLSNVRRGVKHTDEQKRRLGAILIKVGTKTRFKKGIKPWNWKGKIAVTNKEIRKTVEYKLWRTAVFERDGYTCVWCGVKFVKGVTGRVQLNADHIKPFAYFPALRFAIDNGRTLCIPCHKNTDTYGYRALKAQNAG